MAARKTPWRDAVLLEYHWVNENAKCVRDCSSRGNLVDAHDINCVDPEAWEGCWSTRNATWYQLPTECKYDCYPTETSANNFVAIRHVGGAGAFGDSLYAEFQTGHPNGHVDNDHVDFSSPRWVELFNVTRDPWQMNNTYATTGSALRNLLQRKLRTWLECTGVTCP